MDKKEKTVRLVDVSELEADLKKELAKEDAKGKGADILFCESIEDELSDLENLPRKPSHHRPEVSAACGALGRNSWLLCEQRWEERIVVRTCNTLYEPEMRRGQSVRPQNAVLSDVRIQNGGRAV